MRALVVAIVLAAACGHIPPGQTEGVPPPWPPAPAAVKPVAPAPAPPAGNEPKPVVPPLKDKVVPPAEPPPQTD